MTEQEIRLKLIEIAYVHGQRAEEILSKAEKFHEWVAGQPKGPVQGESNPVSTPRRGRPPKGQGD